MCNEAEGDHKMLSKFLTYAEKLQEQVCKSHTKK